MRIRFVVHFIDYAEGNGINFMFPIFELFHDFTGWINHWIEGIRKETGLEIGIGSFVSSVSIDWGVLLNSATIFDFSYRQRLAITN